MSWIDDLYTCVDAKCQQRAYGTRNRTIAQLFTQASFVALKNTKKGASVQAHYKDYQSWRATKSVADMKNALEAYYTHEHDLLVHCAKRDAILSAAIAKTDADDLGLLLVEKGLSGTIKVLKSRQTKVPPTPVEGAALNKNIPSSIQEPPSQNKPPPDDEKCDEPTAPVAVNAQPEKTPAEKQREADLALAATYTKKYPSNKLSGTFGLFASTYFPLEKITADVNGASPIPTLSQNAHYGMMPLVNAQHRHIVSDKTDIQDYAAFGAKARKELSSTIAGSWRFHGGYKRPLLLTPRMAALTYQAPVFVHKDYYGLPLKTVAGSYSVTIGLIPKDPALTKSRGDLYEGATTAGNCACVGDLNAPELQTCAVPSGRQEVPSILKPNTTLLPNSSDSGEDSSFALGLGWNSGNEKWQFSTVISPKSLPKFKPGAWNTLPKPIFNVTAINASITYKPRQNILIAGQASQFGAENRLSLVSRAFWKNGTNAGIALDYGNMPNRLNDAQLEPMALARGVFETRLNPKWDFGAMASAGRYFNTEKSFYGFQLNTTYKPGWKLGKRPVNLNLAITADTRYRYAINLGGLMDIK